MNAEPHGLKPVPAVDRRYGTQAWLLRMLLGLAFAEAPSRTERGQAQLIHFS